MAQSSGVHRRSVPHPSSSDEISSYFDPYDLVEMKDMSTSHSSDYKHADELEDVPLMSLPYHQRFGSGALPDEILRVRPGEQPPERESTRPGPGLWREQMLVDRTLRVMAATTAFFAVTLIVVCIVLAPKLATHLRQNPYSTSVAIASGSRASMNRRSEALKFFINVGATMVLGMSNTYQQLVTALSIKDIKYMLTKFGDSRVGTNSPFAINHKRDGRRRAWFAWILLVMTSMPVHLLANSLVGVSSYYQTPTHVVQRSTVFSGDIYSSSFICWSALRLGRALSADGDTHIFGSTSDSDICSADSQDQQCKKCTAGYYSDYFPPVYTTASCKTLTVAYDGEACGSLVGGGTSTASVLQEWVDLNRYVELNEFGNCTFGMYSCDISDNTCEDENHLVVRMLAAIVLAACLSIKAVYMVATNLRGRHKLKSHCLTFGDILVASVMDSSLQVQNECMVNGGDFHRRQVAHECHKHCRDTDRSSTGEEIGHCQKCKRFNSVNNMPNLAWPALAMKRKKSLITNLGQAALTQMLTLSFSSMAMIAASIVLALLFVETWSFAVCMKHTTYAAQSVSSQIIATFSLPSLSGEIAAICISNGAQLLYSMLYLLLIYNLSLISMEWDWGRLEKERRRLRCTIVRSGDFDQSYLMQLPRRVLVPTMLCSVVMHWLLGLAILAEEAIVYDGEREWSTYTVVTVPSAVWGSSALLLSMTAVCWWAFTYRREGFIPQMYGSIRTLCASTTALEWFPASGIQWGDLGEQDGFRHAGFSAKPVDKIAPNEIYI